MDRHSKGFTPLFALCVGYWFCLLVIYDQTDGLAVILYGGREKLTEIFLQRITMMFFGNPRLEAEINGHGEGSTPLYVLCVGSWFRFHLIYEQTDGLAVILYGGREKLVQIFLERIMTTFFRNPRLDAQMNGHLRVGSWFCFHLIYDHTYALAVILYGGRQIRAEIFLQRIMTTFFMNWIHTPE